MNVIDVLTPYEELEHSGIQYAVCREFNHISRYRCLRQVVRNPNSDDRFISLETPNSFTTNCDIIYYDVSQSEENRLDLIAAKLLGAASYSWVLAYFNGIEDGFTVRPGQRLVVPKYFSSLFSDGEILTPVTALQLNIGDE